MGVMQSPPELEFIREEELPSWIILGRPIGIDDIESCLK
jgi:hypothetical protein